MRLHITGASGAGVSTLGAALAHTLAVPHHDTDDYYWYPTDPPFREKRPVSERLRLMEEMFLPRPSWVLSGSLDSWSETLVPRFEGVVFVETPTEVRLRRLREREALRGAQTAAGEHVGGFLAWAACYEDGTMPGRSRARHEAWLAELPCPVVRVEGTRDVEELVREVLTSLGAPIFHAKV